MRNTWYFTNMLQNIVFANKSFHSKIIIFPPDFIRKSSEKIQRDILYTC
jgi:hypothetical protein